METVTSRDGTPIAFERTGQGPPLVLVDGALCQRKFGPMPKLAPLLAPSFTVFHYDRRGRGDSGDTAPYAVEREVEDLAAVIGAADGPVFLHGVSSGAALALEGARRGLPVRKLVLYEAPFIVDASRAPLTDEDLARLSGHIAAGRRGAAVRTFMRLVGAPAPVIFLMRFLPGWSKLEAVAPTLAYDFAIVGDFQRGKALPAERWRALTVPTQVVVGGKSPLWMQNGMRALAAALPGAEHRVVAGQTHMIGPRAHARMLVECLRA